MFSVPDLESILSHRSNQVRRLEFRKLFAAFMNKTSTFSLSVISGRSVRMARVFAD
jgi:hypothetical protein